MAAAGPLERRAKLKRHPSDIHLRELAKEVGCECGSLSTYLGFKQNEYEQLRQNHYSFEDQVFNMLTNWKQRNYSHIDLFVVLRDALKLVNREDLACKVEEWRDEPHKSRDILDPPESLPARPKLHRSRSMLEEVDLRDLSSKIGAEWEKFATYLGLKATEVYKIKFSHTYTNDRVFQVLIKWKQKMSKHTNMVKTLAKALEDSGRVDLKVELLEKYGYRFQEEQKQEDVKQDLLKLYDLPPFLGEIQNGYKKITNPVMPFDLFLELCVGLDPPDSLGNDWRRLADRLNLSQYIHYLESQYKDGPTSGVLWCWSKTDKPLKELADTLKEMNRNDVAMKIYDHLGIKQDESNEEKDGDGDDV